MARPLKNRATAQSDSRPLYTQKTPSWRVHLGEDRSLKSNTTPNASAGSTRFRCRLEPAAPSETKLPPATEATLPPISDPVTPSSKPPPAANAYTTPYYPPHAMPVVSTMPTMPSSLFPGMYGLPGYSSPPAYSAMTLSQHQLQASSANTELGNNAYSDSKLHVGPDLVPKPSATANSDSASKSNVPTTNPSAGPDFPVPPGSETPSLHAGASSNQSSGSKATPSVAATAASSGGPGSPNSTPLGMFLQWQQVTIQQMQMQHYQQMQQLQQLQVQASRCSQYLESLRFSLANDLMKYGLPKEQIQQILDNASGAGLSTDPYMSGAINCMNIDQGAMLYTNAQGGYAGLPPFSMMHATAGVPPIATKVGATNQEKQAQMPQQESSQRNSPNSSAHRVPLQSPQQTSQSLQIPSQSLKPGTSQSSSRTLSKNTSPSTSLNTSVNLSQTPLTTPSGLSNASNMHGISVQEQASVGSQLFPGLQNGKIDCSKGFENMNESNSRDRCDVPEGPKSKTSEFNPRKNSILESMTHEGSSEIPKELTKSENLSLPSGSFASGDDRLAAEKVASSANILTNRSPSSEMRPPQKDIETSRSSTTDTFNSGLRHTSSFKPVSFRMDEHCRPEGVPSSNTNSYASTNDIKLHKTLRTRGVRFVEVNPDKLADNSADSDSEEDHTGIGESKLIESPLAVEPKAEVLSTSEEMSPMSPSLEISLPRSQQSISLSEETLPQSKQSSKKPPSSSPEPTSHLPDPVAPPPKQSSPPTKKSLSPSAQSLPPTKRQRISAEASHLVAIQKRNALNETSLDDLAPSKRRFSLKAQQQRTRSRKIPAGVPPPVMPMKSTK